MASVLAGCSASDENSTDREDTKKGKQQQTKQVTETPSTATESMATESVASGSDGLQGGYVVKIIATGKWSGAIVAGGSSRSIEGEGTKTFQLDGNPTIISANAQKQAANSDKLTIQIIKDGEVIKENSTSAEYGLAQVSTAGFDTGNENNGKKSPYTIKISYEGEWSGTYSSAGNLKSIDGSGTKTFPVKGDPIIISANAQKRDGGAGTLTVQILKNGTVIKESTTSAEYGLASVTVSV